MCAALIGPAALMAASCTPQQPVSEIATSTLAPLVTLTPRATATPAVSRTPLPTHTLTPSLTPIPPTTTTTYTPSPTPPIMGIVNSLETVNVRIGPGANFSAFEALIPGTEIQVVGQDETGRWLNVRLADGREGWINSPLVRVDPTPTSFPSVTPPPDQTAMAQGSPFPTALIGGGTITPTPPGIIVATPTTGFDLPDMPPTSTEIGAQPVTPVLPVINFDPINATSTALAAILGTPVPTAAASTASLDGTPLAITETNQPIPTNSGPVSAPTTSGEPIIQRGVDLYVNCDAPPRGSLRAPTNLAAGSTPEIWWYWYARTEAQIADHLAAAVYEIKINGQPLRRPMDFAQPVRKSGDYVVDFFYPTGELAAGTYKIDYRVTWRQQIYDGYNFFGPGTNTLSETGTCTFVVR